MRSLVLLCLLGACDPVWHVENVATAKQPTTPTEACVEAGIKASGMKFSEDTGGIAKPARAWYVNGARVEWDPRKPITIKLSAAGVGTEPPPGSVDRYRTTRDQLIPSLDQSCGGTFDVSGEECARVKGCMTVEPKAP